MPAAPAAAQGQNEQQEQRGSVWGTMIRMVIFMLVINSFLGKGRTPEVKDPSTGAVLPPYENAFVPGTMMNLYVYISEQSNFMDFSDNEKLVWYEQDIKYGDWDDSNSRARSTIVRPSEAVMNNGTLWAHVYFAKRVLSRYMPERKIRAVKSLLSDKQEEPGQAPGKEAPVEPEEERRIISYWLSNFTLNVIDDQTKYPRQGIPPPIAEHLKLVPDASSRYYPIIYFNDFWTLVEDYQPINQTTPSLDLHMTFAPMSLMKFQMMTQFEKSLDMQQQMGASEGERDEFKAMLMDNSPWLLGVTFVVSMLHTVFDFLAFKNDISFWKNNKSMEGLSVRTIFINVFSQLVIFLYLWDNDTSWIIVISSGVGLVIEVWKVTKAVFVGVEWRNGLPRLSFKEKQTYTSKTKEFDQLAMHYLSYLLYPLLVGYAIYSLLYEEHKGWYSWILGSLTGAIYTFGFIMMTPQLFINYKMKSVAHLPWKVFVYKALNTFIDDLFAFVIRMPTLHRIACFRDDIVFLIFLYQKWLYPTDYTRANEYGQVAEPAPGSDAAADAIVDTEPAAGTDGDSTEVVRPSGDHQVHADGGSAVRRRGAGPTDADADDSDEGLSKLDAVD